MRIRQIALVTRNLDPVVDDLCAVLGLEVCFHDPGVEVFGLRNALLPVGDTFLEVLAPVKPDTTAGRFLDRREGDGGYMVIVQTDDLAADRARIAKLGVRVVWEIAFDDVATVHLHPSDVGGAIVSLDEARPPESWRWAGPRWREHARTDRVLAIVGVELEAAEPVALASRWSQVLGHPSARTGAREAAIALDGSAIRFAPCESGRADGIRTVDLAATPAGREAALAAARERGLPTRDDSVSICGTWLRLL
jgi:hypothetical protein